MVTRDRADGTAAGRVILEAACARAAIEVRFGGQIVSLQDPAGHEYTAISPWLRPEGLPLTAGYLEGGLGGIDDCIPAVAAGPYPASPYGDWSVPDHGELWMRPAEVTSSAPTELVLSMRGVHLPYRLVRRFRLSARALRVDYMLVSRSAVDLPIVWTAHALLAATPGMTIDIGTQEALQVDATASPGITPFSRVRYPQLEYGGQVIDLRYWDSLPQGFYAKLFGPLPSGRPARLHHPIWGTALEVTCRARQPMHIGLWINRYGIPAEQPLEHVALEPTFGSADRVDRALADGSCLVLRAGGVKRWSVTYRIVPD